MMPESIRLVRDDDLGLAGTTWLYYLRERKSNCLKTIMDGDGRRSALPGYAIGEFQQLLHGSTARYFAVRHIYKTSAGLQHPVNFGNRSWIINKIGRKS